MFLVVGGWVYASLLLTYLQWFSAYIVLLYFTIHVLNRQYIPTQITRGLRFRLFGKNNNSRRIELLLLQSIYCELNRL